MKNIAGQLSRFTAIAPQNLEQYDSKSKDFSIEISHHLYNHMVSLRKYKSPPNHHLKVDYG